MMCLIFCSLVGILTMKKLQISKNETINFEDVCNKYPGQLLPTEFQRVKKQLQTKLYIIIGTILLIIMLLKLLCANGNRMYNSYYIAKGGIIMLIFEFTTIGNRLFPIRKRMGLTQAEVAEAANLSTRTYADIERGSVNMRIETILKICNVLHITPDEILTTDDSSISDKQQELWKRLNSCSPKDKETALKLLSVYLESLK